MRRAGFQGVSVSKPIGGPLSVLRARSMSAASARSSRAANWICCYDCHCYLPLYVSCGSQLLAAKLRRSNIDASAGAVEEIARIVAQIRAYWPRVEILLRADSGFARAALMSWCEAHRVDDVFGLARNERLVGAIAADLALAEAESLAQGGAARGERHHRNVAIPRASSPASERASACGCWVRCGSAARAP
jgi:Transposase DDE domain group 1